MNTRMALWLLAVPSIALAGCTDGGGTDDTTPGEIPADFEELGLTASTTTGILRGVVIDEAIRPMAGVLITALKPAGGNLTMQTAEDGLFGFDGLEPGTYFVTAAKEGYITVQASGEVVAGDGEPDAVKLLLKADPSLAPYIQQQHLDGYVTCSVRGMILAYPCGFGGEDIVAADYEMPRMPDWIQSEMIWQSTQAVGDELSLSIRCLPDSDPAGLCQDGQQGIARSEGVSPQIATINRTLIEQWKLGGADGNPLSVWIYAFGRSDLDVYDEETIDPAQEGITGDPCLYWQDQGFLFGPNTCMRATGPGLIVNQKVDVYTHMFYGFLPDEGWTFIEDGPHSAPSS